MPGQANTRLANAAAQHLLDYDWKLWGFGESIGLKALLALDEHQLGTGFEDRDIDYQVYVENLVRPWCEKFSRPVHADHVAPGSVLLELYLATDDGIYLETALKLASLHRTFGSRRGVAVHRPDLDGLSTLIWVDCMALDAPFLAALGALTGDQQWTTLAVDYLNSYANALLDRRTALFRHGFDTADGTVSCCNWARGNGWALHGLIDTIAELPQVIPDAHGCGNCSLARRGQSLPCSMLLACGTRSWTTLIRHLRIPRRPFSFPDCSV